jgi:hypothetical protein
VSACKTPNHKQEADDHWQTFHGASRKILSLIYDSENVEATVKRMVYNYDEEKTMPNLEYQKKFTTALKRYLQGTTPVVHKNLTEAGLVEDNMSPMNGKSRLQMFLRYAIGSYSAPPGNPLVTVSNHIPIQP